MSERFPGGYLTNNPPAPTGASAPGVWTMDQALQNIRAGTWPDAGLYIEDLFSTYLYTGNGSTQTINNGINLSGQGGMVWFKDRNNPEPGWIFDTLRGGAAGLRTPLTSSANNNPSDITSFNSTGFTLGNGNVNYSPTNPQPHYYASWTFRKAPKFFDVVTYTGNGVGRAINHSLGVAPGMFVIKQTSNPAAWYVYHRSAGSNGPYPNYLALNQTDAAFAGQSNLWSAAPTATEINIGSNSEINTNGQSYVAYLFAHDTNSNGVIQCGSFTADGSGTATVSLGWEPQFCIIKSSSNNENWYMLDTMRGWNMSTSDAILYPNLSDSEVSSGYGNPTATGFDVAGLFASRTYIYIAIRRGPMRTPTTGTSVFTPVLGTTYSSSPTPTGAIPTNFTVDSAWIGEALSTSGSAYPVTSSRLTGNTYLSMPSTNNEGPWTSVAKWDRQTGFGEFNFTGYVGWAFQRAPRFFDVVCYTGNGNASQLVAHNLGAAPELYICKRRDGMSSWEVWSKTPGVDSVYTLALQSTGAGVVSASYNGYATSTTVEVGGQVASNTSTATYVAYLFTSCPGVSKVGRYTGTGSTLQVDCGFTGGARFVLIKRIDNSGDWYVWDSARGITSGNDPYILLNTGTGQTSGTNYVDTAATGFQITSSAPAAINANGGTFIYLAIA